MATMFARRSPVYVDCPLDQYSAYLLYFFVGRR